MLGEIARAPAGRRRRADLMNPARVREASYRTRVPSAGLIDEQRSVRDEGRIVEKCVRVTEADGKVRSWRESVRMYDVEEMRTLLAGRGLRLEAVEGGFEDEPLGPDAPRQILRARRAPAPV